MARDTFNATVETLTVAIEAGEFSDNQALAILTAVKAGRDALDLWEAAVMAHEPYEDTRRHYDAILARLMAFKKERS